MAETVVPPSQAVERPARRRWDPLSPASRIWIAFALALLLICTTGFSMPLVFGIEDNDLRRDEFATVLGEAVGNVVFVVYLVLTLLYFWREKPDRIRARAEARYGRPRRRLRRLLPFARILLVVMVAWGAVTAAAIDLPEAQAIAPHETGLLTVFATGDVILSWFILH